MGTAASSNLNTIICDATTISAGVVNSDGTTAVLGTINSNATSAGTHAHTFSNGSNSLSLNYTIDSEIVYQANPIPGTDGQIGNTALFDGNGYIELTDSTIPLNLAKADFTLMTWVKTDQPHAGILAKNDGDTVWEPGEKVFYIANGTGYPSFVGWGNDYIRGNVDITDNLWHHVAVVWDYDGSGIEGVGRIYVDGVDVTGYDSYRASQDDVSGNTLKIGAPNYAEAQRIFAGQLDELAAYQRALTAAEIETIHLLELRWYRDHAVQEVVVDSDNPTVNMLSTNPYLNDGYVQLAAQIEDATSRIALAQFGLKQPGESSFTWQTAVSCTDSPITYCPAFTTAGEGTYEVQFRAVDSVGNETVSSVYSYYVDTTPPTISGNGTPLAFTIVETSNDAWTITLDGTISDPLIGSVAGSGVHTNTLRLTLTDERGHILGIPHQPADAIVGSAWTATYDVSGAAPLGHYTVAATVADVKGNQTTATLGTITLDERPPTSHYADVLSSRTISSANIISTTQTITGVVTEQDRWSGAILDLHFEEAAGSQQFYDYGRYANHATCITCPTTTTSPFGNALDFDGVDDRLDALHNNGLTIQGDATIALWVNPDNWYNSNHTPLVVKGDGSLSGEHANYYFGKWNNGDQALSLSYHTNGSWQDVVDSSGTTYSDGTWVHLALVMDVSNNQVHFYKDGQHLSTHTQDFTANPLVANSQPVAIGQYPNSGHAVFDGQMDELVIYDHALTADQIYQLAQADISTVWRVEAAVAPVDFSTYGNPLDEAAQPWQVVGLPYTGTATWSYTVPDSGLEGYYQIHLRSQDTVGNYETASTIWSGLIDQVPPTITGSGARGYLGGIASPGATAVTTYTYTFNDFLLDQTRLTHPCAAGDLVSLTYNDSTLPYDGSPYQLSATCTVTGHETTRTLTACDMVGHCHSEIVHSVSVAPIFSASIAANGSIIDSSTPQLTGMVTNTYAADTDVQQRTTIDLRYRQGNGAVWPNLAPDALTLYMPFDQGYNEDLTGNSSSITCPNCPLTEQPGQHGRAITLDGIDDYVRVDTDFDPTASPFTIGLWFNTHDNTTRRILQQDQGRSLLNLYSSGVLNTFLGGGTLLGTTVVTANSWHHAAVTYDGTTLRLYLDGNLEASEVRTMEPSTGDILVGVRKQLDKNFFDGSVDELVIFKRALDATELQTLMLSPWRSATINTPTGDNTTSTWFYDPQVEGIYAIDIWLADDLGHERYMPQAWSGYMDQVPPSISATAAAMPGPPMPGDPGGPETFETSYSFTFSDFLLDQTSYVQPCHSSALSSLTYSDSTMPYNGLPYYVDGSCTEPGAPPSYTFTACDMAGNCTSETVYP